MDLRFLACLRASEAPARRWIGLAILALTTHSAGARGDWLHFRGNDGTALTSDAAIPKSWVEGRSQAWKVELPGRGPSSPIVVGDAVVVTASTGPKQDRLHVLCLDEETGSRRWHRQLWATGRTVCYADCGVAAPSPASDGRRVFAFFSSNDLACLDLEGNLLWVRGLAHDYPGAGNDVGMASSPVVVGATVVVQVENPGDSFAAGLDVDTGETRWRVPREKGAVWSSPVIVRGTEPTHDLVLLQSHDRLTALWPQTGGVAWEYPQPCDGIASCVVAGARLFVPSRGLTALRLQRDVEPQVVWQAGNLKPDGASPVVLDDRVYVVNSAGVLVCGDAGTGRRLWNLRLEGKFWATPLIGERHILCVNQDGVLQVVDRDSHDVVLRHELKETIWATPAAHGEAVFIRGDRHLWKIWGNRG